jgi:hypothetical protein
MRPRSSPQNWPLRSRGAGKRTGRDILRALVIGLDRWLRRRQGIVAFCQDPDCLLRISKATAPVTTVLSDGIRVNAGDPIIELHFWNERLPRLPEGGVGLRWALWAGHRFARSLELLADHVVKDVRLSQVVALRSETIFTTADNGRALAGVARHLGFDVCERPAGRVDELGQRPAFVGARLGVQSPCGGPPNPAQATAVRVDVT